MLANPISPDTLLGNFGLLGLAIILFAECGLLVGFFLPGDTILLAAGIALSIGTIHAPLAAFLIVCPVAAIAGNLVGYWIGRRTGPVVFDRPGSKLFRPEYVDRSHAFFERFGWPAIFLARFVPIVRTVASVAGGIIWTDGVLLLGYGLGHVDFVRQHKSWIDYLVIVAVLIGLVPVAVHYLQARRAAKRQAKQQRPVSGGTSSTSP